MLLKYDDEVEFAEGIKKLQYPDSINKFIKLSTDKYNTAIEDYLLNEQEKKIVETELKNVKRELEALERLD